MIELLPALVLAAQAATSTAMPRPAMATPARPEIVIYSDFQCPFCRQFAAPTRDVGTNGLNGHAVTVTFKHFPLPFHRSAQLAHQAAEAAKAQGKFWEMHDLLFANQARLQRADLLGYAQALGLDLVRFERDLDSSATRQAIAADIAEGQRAGITATPSYSIHGRIYEGTRTVSQIAGLLSGGDIRSVEIGRPAASSPSHDRAFRSPEQVTDITDTMLSMGPPNAAVTLEIFVDLQSSISGAALDAAENIYRRFPGVVRVQFRSYPLAFHPQAPLAHEAAMVAARSGKLWEFTRAVLAQQSSMREDDLAAIARTVGLNEHEFREALHQHRYLARVEADRDDGVRRGVRGSPAFVLNGKRIDGLPTVQTLSANVEEALDDMRGNRVAGK